MAEGSGTKALFEVVIAIVLVVAAAAILLGALSWLSSILWLVFKFVLLAAVVYVVVRIVVHRRAST